MYQICTSTAVNNGEPRGLTVTRKPYVNRANIHLPGAPQSTGHGLITRRSQVQILPPPPTKALVDRKICQGFVASRGRSSNHSSNHVVRRSGREIAIGEEFRERCRCAAVPSGHELHALGNRADSVSV